MDKIYVFGGYASNYTYSRTDEYDPIMDTWTMKTSMPTARWGHTTCSLNGKVYVIGGAKGWPVEIIYETIEVYDPVMNTWETKSSIPTPRWMPSCSVMDGKIYVIGGHDSLGAVSAVEIYDPATDYWTIGENLPTARWGLGTFTAGGKIYAIGGGDKYPASTAYFVVEEYDPVKDSWETSSPMPGGRIAIATSSVNNLIYVPGGGGLNVNIVYPELFIYDPGINGIGSNQINHDNIFPNVNPNPFTTSTTLSYELKQPVKVSLIIYNHLGKIVYQITENQPQGNQQLIWNAESYPKGVYYYRLQVGNAVANGKLVKVK